MSFNFGSSPAFGATSTASPFAAKPTAFGAPMVNTSATATPSFGLGTAAAPSTGFGAFGSTPAATTGFGGFGGFGTTTTTAASTGFGGFGAFGATPSSAPSTGFSFGATTSAAPSTGFSFGAATSAAPATGFNFGATTTTASGFGGFGGFGTTPATAGGGLFGGGLGQTSTTGAFGGFGSSFGQKPATNFGLGGSTFGAPQQQQQPIDPNVAFSESILNCQVFGDERDNILKRWNILQALYGFGKGFYNAQAPGPVEYDLFNPLCRFKGIAYNAKPTAENKDGCVKLVVNKKADQLKGQEQQIIDILNTTLGNKPNVTPTIENIASLSESKSLIIISVQEKAANGATRRVPAQELANFFCQPMMKQQLNNLQVENVLAQVAPTSEQIREYLENPPAGMDPQMWQQAQDENPFPDRMIPVPVVGFEQVRWRLKCQEAEAGMQQAVLDHMADEMAQLQRKHHATVANIADYKLRLVDLQHRVLKLILLQEKSRKFGMALMPEEEALNSRLESLTAAINSSSFKNRLTTLTEGVKSLSESNKEPQRYKMDNAVVSDIKQFLTMSQSGISHMVETTHSDVTEVKTIKDGMARILQRPDL